MKPVKLSEATVGSILDVPVIYNDVVLYSEGTPVTLRMIQHLSYLRIKEIYVKPILSIDLDNKLLADKESKLLRLALKSKGIDAMSLYSRELTSFVMNTRYEPLVRMVSIYDNATYIHSVNVANLAVTFGQLLGLNKKELEYLAIGSLIHDLGKTLIPKEIINKPSRLSDEEYAIIKKHTEYGYNLVKGSKSIPVQIKKIILQHHENFDGSGYPYGLYGTQITKLSRIVHICDVYEAMCAKRAYKSEMERHRIKEYMLSNAYILFDPFLINKFCSEMPLYLTGEQVSNGKYYGTVLNSIWLDNPIILLGDKQYTYYEFLSYGVS